MSASGEGVEREGRAVIIEKNFLTRLTPGENWTSTSCVL